MNRDTEARNVKHIEHDLRTCNEVLRTIAAGKSHRLRQMFLARKKALELEHALSTCYLELPMPLQGEL